MLDADINGYNSLAIPALGTGGLGYPPQDAANILLDELVEFSKRNPKTSLKDVRIVLLHVNTDFEVRNDLLVCGISQLFKYYI